MKSARLLISYAELEILRALIGQRWSHYGLPAGFPDGERSVMEAFVETEEDLVSFRLELTEMEFEGFPDEYTTFTVCRGSDGLRAARAHGDLYFHFRGNLIRDILIVRDTTRGLAQDLVAFEFVRDVGVVLLLDDGCIGIVGGNPWGQLIRVTHATDRSDLLLRDGADLWDSTLELHHESHREILALTSALMDSPTDDQS